MERRSLSEIKENNLNRRKIHIDIIIFNSSIKYKEKISCHLKHSLEKHFRKKLITSLNNPVEAQRPPVPSLHLQNADADPGQQDPVLWLQ